MVVAGMVYRRLASDMLPGEGFSTKRTEFQTPIPSLPTIGRFAISRVFKQGEQNVQGRPAREASSF
jgi:hypothetical protein